MDKEYDYTIYPDNSMKKFKETCKIIEENYPDMEKHELLIDVDGSLAQVYGDKMEIIVYDDYDVGAVYVKSDIDLSVILC